MKYNIRNKQGKFVKITTPNKKVVAGRLYDWKGITVRAFGPMGNKRVVSAHKELFGIVSEDELKPITKEQVDAYLAKA